MKILHIGKYYPPFHGGMEVYLRDLAETQTKDNDVTVLVHNHEFNILFSRTVSEKLNGVHLIRQKSLKPVLFTPLMLGLRKTISDLISKNKPDVIHISWPNPSALFLLLIAAARRTPWVIQWQSDMVTKRSTWMLKFAYQFFRLFERQLLKRAAKVIVSTEEYFKYSPALRPYAAKCEFIPLGFHFSRAEIEKDDLQWADELWGHYKYKLYNIGRLTFYKNQKILIEAAKRLPEAKFIITGSGQLQDSLSRLISKEQLDNVVLTGSLSSSRLHALLKSCDIFCLPSNDRAESYGMVLLEALSYGKPILVSNLNGSGMKWIASQTVLGHTFDCNSVEDLIDKIQSLNLSVSADESIYEKFNMGNCSDRIQKLYQSIV